MNSHQSNNEEIQTGLVSSPEPYKHILVNGHISFLPTFKKEDGTTAVAEHTSMKEYSPTPTLQEIIETWAKHQNIEVPTDYRFDLFPIQILEDEISSAIEHTHPGITANELEKAFANGSKDKRIIVYITGPRGYRLSEFPDREIVEIFKKYCIFMDGNDIYNI